MKLKRLLILAPSYHPHSGGVETHIRRVVARLRLAGYDPLIVVRYAAELPADYQVDGVRVIRCPRPGDQLNQLLWTLRYLPLLLRTDVVHSHDFFPLQLYRLLKRRRWVHTFHGYEGYPLDPAAIVSRQEVRRLVPICVGVGEFIEKWYGTPCEAWLYGAVDADRLPPPKPAKWDIIFYGRLEEDTGFKGYLEAFKAIRRHHPKTTMVVVGSGSLQDWAEAFCTEHKLDVSFVPATAEVLEYATQARVGFVSGYLAILEVAALGKPIVALYENPLKHDYLTCHPMAERFAIVGSSAEVATAYTKAKTVTPAQLTAFQTWARQQSWERIAQLYAGFYRQ